VRLTFDLGVLFCYSNQFSFAKNGCIILKITWKSKTNTNSFVLFTKNM